MDKNTAFVILFIFVALAAGGLVAFETSPKQIAKRRQKREDKSSELKRVFAEKKAMQDLEKTGIKPTLSRNEALNIANAMYASMNGIGTYYYDFYNLVKKIKNNADFILVSQAFGNREGSNLIQWVGSEAQINKKIVNQYLTDNNVSYQF